MAPFPPSDPPFRPTGSPLETLIAEADRALRTLAGIHTGSTRPCPADDHPETVDGQQARRHVASLMRINHAGEVAAQALYHGQAFVARQPETRASLLRAAAEEGDHLAWCEQRLAEVGGRTSLLNPFWYGGSFAIGAIAGSINDALSLGFVAETERQVIAHLDSHLDELPKADERTRAIIEQMRSDEARHGDAALRAGGAALPAPVRIAMRLTAKVMTGTARWI